MSQLNVNTETLHGFADQYRELQARAMTISPAAVDAVQQVIDTHGKMGYPVAVGLLVSLSRREEALNNKALDFHTYAQRFTEHAVTYGGQDAAAAATYTPRPSVL